MDLELLLFASLKDDVGSPTLRLTIPEGSTVSTLLQEIGRAHPYLQEKLAHVRVAIGDEFADPEAIISADQEIALIPPVSGG
ncbi:MAG: MoaD/ThiS family protein [Planctomycetota bacterium]